MGKFLTLPVLAVLITILSFLPQGAHATHPVSPISVTVPHTYLNEKYSATPTVCIYGNSHDSKIALEAISEWQKGLREYTHHNSSWNINTELNQTDQTKCVIVIKYLEQPTPFIFSEKPDFEYMKAIQSSGIIGQTVLFSKQGVIIIYTTTYYHDELRTMKDSSNKVRPMAGLYPYLDDQRLLHVSEHELGHAFGILHHNENNSIMVEGFDKIKDAHISKQDLQEVISVTPLFPRGQK